MPTTRAEHLAWRKERARAELENPDEAKGIANAWASMTSDLTQHPETEAHDAITLGMMLIMGGHLSTKAEMAKFIDDFT